MSMTVSGPMFEGSISGPWKSIHKKEGAHYNIYATRDEHGMAALREMFPNGEGNDLNFVLFSTSGVHGTYGTIEDAEQQLILGVDEDGEPTTPSVTFLLIHPRIVCLRYGNCNPKDAADIAFLKALRESSYAAVSTIGKADAS